jgi:hypothetical protein
MGMNNHNILYPNCEPANEKVVIDPASLHTLAVIIPGPITLKKIIKLIIRGLWKILR